MTTLRTSSMGAEDMGWSDEKRQIEGLAVILSMNQADIQAGNFRDADEFFVELDAEYLAIS